MAHDEVNGTVKKKAHIQQPVEKMEWREAVEFLINLASIEDPEKLRPGDRLNLIDDLHRFLEIEEDGHLASEVKRLELEPKHLTETIDGVREVVEAAAEKQNVEFQLKGSRLLVFRGDRIGRRGAVLLDGELRDTMIDCAAADIEDAEPWQICRCAEPECRKIFMAGRKGQKFCSHACANVVAGRVYRGEHASERATREKARYQRKNKAATEASKK
jgi:hypothetical protein